MDTLGVVFLHTLCMFLHHLCVFLHCLCVFLHLVCVKSLHKGTILEHWAVCRECNMHILLAFITNMMCFSPEDPFNWTFDNVSICLFLPPFKIVSKISMINRSGAAGAVLQTASSLTDWLIIHSLMICENFFTAPPLPNGNGANKSDSEFQLLTKKPWTPRKITPRKQCINFLIKILFFEIPDLVQGPTAAVSFVSAFIFGFARKLEYASWHV